MYTRGIVVVAITRAGGETALKIKKALDNWGLTSAVYAPKKYSQNGVIPLEKGFADFFKNLSIRRMLWLGLWPPA